MLVAMQGALTSVPALKAITGTDVVAKIWRAPLIGDIVFHVDGLSAWFILIINLTCLHGALYGIGYMKSYCEKLNLSLHWILFLFFQSSMLWVCMVQNGLGFLIVWELMSISSFLLVIFEHQDKTVLNAGINYLVQMHIGVLFLSAGFIWVYISEGSLEFSAIGQFFSRHSNLWLFLLFFVGFGIKAGFVPMHTWLPQAHPAAPSHISGVMSGVIVKLGIFGILRVLFMLKRDFTVIGQIVIVISIVTGLYGILNAAVHRDFKKMLAYCTIENIGLIGIGMGLGILGLGINNYLLIVLGFSAALLHTLNHSLFKSMLFFSTGSVYQQTHTRDMEKLGGLIRSMPETGLLFLIGAIAIGGLPPFNGFISEFILYSGIIAGIKSIGTPQITLMVISLAGLALIGGLSLLTFTKSFGTIFLGNTRTPMHTPMQEPSLLMRVPQYLILIIMFSIGLLPQYYFTIIYNILIHFFSQVSTHPRQSLFPLISSLTAIGKISLSFIALLALIFFSRRMISQRRPLSTEVTWGCGYMFPSVRMQYTGKSFSKSLGRLLNFILLERKKYNEIRSVEIFPAERKYSSHYNDFFVIRLFNGIVDRLLYSLNYFQFIQNGRLQLYILYGIFFIVLVFVGTIFKLI